MYSVQPNVKETMEILEEGMEENEEGILIAGRLEERKEKEAG